MDQDLCLVWLYCVIDGVLRSIGRVRQRGPAPELTDAEGLTIQLWGEIRGLPNLITHHPQPRVPCQAPVNPRFEHVVHALGRWLPVETRAGIEATDKANSLRKAPTN